jgi:hypothetical protein
MKFIMHRNHVLASTTGHSVRFIKGQEVYVPPALRREAITAGAVPADDAAYDEMNKQNAATKNAPTDPLEREEAILDAFAAMKERNRREDFGASGAPHVKALSTELGWDVDAQERNECWAKFLQE